MSDAALLLRAVELALAVCVFEFGWLLARRRDGWPAALAQAAAGCALLLALRFDLAGPAPGAVLACVAVGGLAHAAGLLLRRPRPAPR